MRDDVPCSSGLAAEDAALRKRLVMWCTSRTDTTALSLRRCTRTQLASQAQVQLQVTGWPDS